MEVAWTKVVGVKKIEKKVKKNVEFICLYNKQNIAIVLWDDSPNCPYTGG